MRTFVTIFALLSASVPAVAAELSDSDLLRTASSELSTPGIEEGDGSGATVSTAGLLPDVSEPKIVMPRDVSFGAQNYQTYGTSTVSATESYSLQNLRRKPMAVLTISKWFKQVERSQRGLRWGGAIGFGFARSNMNLVSSSGTHYDGVALTSYLPSVGPATEYFWPVGSGLALGARAGVGRQFLVQSTTAPTANKTLQGNFLEGGPYARIFFGENAFVRVEYLRRSALKSADLGIQRDNTILSLGFGL